MILETYEWSHFWWERSEVKNGRILLIGDSICHGYMDIVQRYMAEIPVDRLTTSFSLDNPGLKTQIALFLENTGLSYSAIHFNNGLHGKHISAEEYEKLYGELLSYIIEKACGAKIIAALSTPVTTESKTEYEPFNFEVLKRNTIVRSLAKKLELTVNDLYTLADGKPEIKNTDGYHFTSEGYEILGNAVAKLL